MRTEELTMKLKHAAFYRLDPVEIPAASVTGVVDFWDLDSMTHPYEYMLNPREYTLQCLAKNLHDRSKENWNIWPRYGGEHVSLFASGKWIRVETDDFIRMLIRKSKRVVNARIRHEIQCVETGRECEFEWYMQKDPEVIKAKSTRLMEVWNDFNDVAAVRDRVKAFLDAKMVDVYQWIMYGIKDAAA